jgi:hypothetical protein
MLRGRQDSRRLLIMGSHSGTSGAASHRGWDGTVYNRHPHCVHAMEVVSQEPVAEKEHGSNENVEGKARAAMLGSCIHLDSLVRVSRSSGSCIYELCLTG